MDKYTVNEFTNVIKFILNRTPDEFIEMYKSIGFISDNYAKEKYMKAKNSFAIWWCELDNETLSKIIIYVNNFYNIKGK